jgi:hypothetical protein
MSMTGADPEAGKFSPNQTNRIVSKKDSVEADGPECTLIARRSTLHPLAAELRDEGAREPFNPHIHGQHISKRLHRESMQ